MILANKSSLGIDMRQDYQANTLTNISNYEKRIKELNSDTNLLRKKHLPHQQYLIVKATGFVQDIGILLLKAQLLKVTIPLLV